MQSSNALRFNKVRLVEFVVLAGLLGAGAYAAFAPSSQQATRSRAQIIDTSFNALSSEYNQNAIAFKEKYAGKIFRLHDTVASISSDPPSVLFAPDPTVRYAAMFDDSSVPALGKLSPGDEITFTCASIVIGMQMDDCHFGKAR